MDVTVPDGHSSPEGGSDANLIAQVLAGESGAFDVLVRRYQARARAVAFQRLRKAQDADDVAQDAFIRAYSSLGTLKDRDRFGPWLMRIVSNLALNALRARKSGTAGASVSLDEIGEKLGLSHSPGDSPASSELGRAIRAGIEALPEKQRLALVLFCVEGLPQREVAAALDCSVELVKWNVFQARKKLREMLAEYL
jgi:RNA polymerase sigma-70 factor (ECF subfamily)